MAIRIDWTVYPDRERRSAFTNRLIPESPWKSAGVPVPECRKVASTLDGDDIEVTYVEDALVKALVVFSRKEPFREKKERIIALIPYLKSWMITDAVSSSLYWRKEEREEVEAFFRFLLDHEEPMAKRLGIVALMDRAFMSEEETEWMLEKLPSLQSPHYLLSMAIAWYFATAYTFHPALTLPYFHLLDDRTGKMAKQKCRDSRRVSKEDKERLKTV